MTTLPTTYCFANGPTTQPLVSVIINNYNYAAYLGDAIDSALQQEYARTEVIVVDDGSTDASHELIAKYGDRIKPVYKSNGGQASALNAGFVESHGEVILFLDADDILLPSALTNVVAAFDNPCLAKVHWPMWLIDAEGNRIGGTRPPQPPAEGDFYEALLTRGPSNIPCSPTSGNAWSRSFLRQVFPIPETVAYYRLCADEYLYTLAPAFGSLKTITNPQGCYRIHGRNIYSAKSFHERLQLELEGYDQQSDALRAALARHGIQVDQDLWKRNSWFHRLDRALSDVKSIIPDGADMVLVDGGTWDAAEAFGHRNARPFVLHDGLDGGPPVESEAAIAELEAIRAAGVRYLVIAWPCFWWFETYARFFEALADSAQCLLRNDVVAIFQVPPVAGFEYGFEHVIGKVQAVP